MIIGGKYFKDISIFKKKKYKQREYFYINGREALSSILIKISNKKVIFVPNYICSSLIEVIDRFKFKKVFYDVDNNLNIKIPNIRDSIVLFINFFGKKNKIHKQILMKNIVIEDTTHVLKNYKKKLFIKKKNYYHFGSFRKFYPSLICGYSSVRNKNFKIQNKELLSLYLNCLAASNLKISYAGKII